MSDFIDFDFQFLSPGWLLLLPLAWGLVYAFTRYFGRLSMWSRECDPKFLALLMPEDGKKHWHWQSWLLFTILTIGLIAMAGPSWQQRDYPLLESATARVIILDLSQSMLVEDVKPDRFVQAFNVASAIVASDFDGETGLVVFAGAAFQVSPLTRDSSTLHEFLAALHPDSMPIDGGRLDLAIDRAQLLLSSSITGTGQIIAITDGADDPQLSLLAAAEASRLGNRVSVLAVGSAQGGPMKNANGRLRRDHNGQFILAKTDFGQLEAVAMAGLGGFVKLSGFGGNIGSLIAELDSVSLEHLQNRQDDSYRDPENGGIWLVWLMLPLTLLLFRKSSLWILLLAVLAPVDGELQAMDFESLWRNSEQRAFRAFQEEQYDRVERLSEDSALLGAALFRIGRHEAAYAAYSALESAESFYNRGNALAFLGRLDEALTAYQQALTLNPALEDAIYNLRLIEAHLATGSAEGGLGQDSEETANSEDITGETSKQSQLGQVDMEESNRQQMDQAGIGASLFFERGRVVEEEDFGSAAIAMRQFLQQFQAEEFNPDPELVRRWAHHHTTDPSEFFRRKFLRDYQRDTSGDR